MRRLLISLMCAALFLALAVPAASRGGAALLLLLGITSDVKGGRKGGGGSGGPVHVRPSTASDTHEGPHRTSPDDSTAHHSTTGANPTPGTKNR